MIAVIVTSDPFDDPTEEARVTIEGEVIGESATADAIRDRLTSEKDPITECEDGRELLRYVLGSYSNGYIMAKFANEESKRVVWEFSEAEYEEWKAETDYETSV